LSESSMRKYEFVFIVVDTGPSGDAGYSTSS
jgi:hypothetical protein